VNVGRIAAVEFEDRPYHRAHLLPLHVSGISGDTQSTESNKGCDDCVISAGATRFLVVRHEPTLVLSRKFPSRSTSDCQRFRISGFQFLADTSELLFLDETWIFNSP
jgi:hypothetical protein